MTTPILSAIALAALNVGLLTEQVIDNKKLSQEFLESQIDESKTTYTKIGDRIIHCTLTTKTGFTVTGEAVCVSTTNFDEKTGQSIAYDNAFGKLWMPYGFLLHQVLNAG